jgi:hypothetical protein
MLQFGLHLKLNNWNNYLEYMVVIFVWYLLLWINLEIKLKENSNPSRKKTRKLVIKSLHLLKIYEKNKELCWFFAMLICLIYVYF